MATLYSPSRKIALVHIPKTGGTSRTTVLSKMGFTTCNAGSGHVRLHDFQRLLRIAVDKLRYVIAVIRNPYEHVVSKWAFTRQQSVMGKPGDQWWHTRQHKRPDTVCRDWQCWPEQYYERHWHAKLYGHDPDSTPQTLDDPFRYWMTVDGEVPQNVRVVRLEEQDAVLSEMLGQRVSFPVSHVSKHKPWPDELSTKGIQAVNKRYRWTFESGYYARQEVGRGSCVYSG